MLNGLHSLNAVRDAYEENDGAYDEAEILVRESRGSEDCLTQKYSCVHDELLLFTCWIIHG